MTSWHHRMFGKGALARLHRHGWLARLFHRPEPPAEVLDAREARAELSTLLVAATKEADAIMARLDGRKAHHHG